MKKQIAKTWGIGSLMLIAGLSASQASAITVGFDRITSNGDNNAASQLSVAITDNADNTAAQFLFSVVAGVPNNPNINVTEIYFDDRTPLFVSPIVITNQVATDSSFSVGSASPPDLPSGNSADPDFAVTGALRADSDVQGNAFSSGLNIGETLTMQIAYASGFDFDDVLTAIASGALRIGLHVRSLVGEGTDEGASDSFVNQPGAVPIPAAALLFLTGLAGFAGVRLKSNKTAAA